MKDKRYPLEPARSVRQADLDARRRALAESLEAVRAAERALSDRTREHDLHREESLRERGKAASLEARTVAESLQASAYLARRDSEEEVLRDRIAKAHGELELARERGEQARAAAAATKAALEAVERHKERWVIDERRAREERSEAEAEDRVLSDLARSKKRV